MVSSPNVIGNIMISRQNLSAAGKSLTSRRKLMSFIECSFLFSLFFYQVHYKYSTCVLLWRFRWFWRKAPGRRKRSHTGGRRRRSSCVGHQDGASALMRVAYKEDHCIGHQD